MKHSKLSASAAYRWTECPGSVPAIASLGEVDTGSVYAEEGTALHAAAERCLLNNASAEDLPSPFTYESDGEIKTIELDFEQREAIQKSLDYVRALGGNPITESRVVYGYDLDVPPEDAFGTCDIILPIDDTIHIIDFKFGRGYVSAFENKQLILYAIGALSSLELLGDTFEHIFLHIVQPRVSSFPQPPFEMVRDDLDEWVEYFRRKAAEVYEAERTFDLKSKEWVKKYLTPSAEACKFCPFKPHCPALFEEVEWVEEQLDIKDRDISGILSKREIIRDFLNAIEKEAMKLLLDGKEIEGYKLIEGRQGNRRWGDAAKLEAKLKELGIAEEKMYAKPSLLSPAQMEKALKKELSQPEIIEEFIVRNPAKPTLAEESVSGKPWSPSADVDEFKVIK